MNIHHHCSQDIFLIGFQGEVGFMPHPSCLFCIVIDMSSSICSWWHSDIQMFNALCVLPTCWGCYGSWHTILLSETQRGGKEGDL